MFLIHKTPTIFKLLAICFDLPVWLEALKRGAKVDISHDLTPGPSAGHCGATRAAVQYSEQPTPAAAQDSSANLNISRMWRQTRVAKSDSFGKHVLGWAVLSMSTWNNQTHNSAKIVWSQLLIIQILSKSAVLTSSVQHIAKSKKKLLSAFLLTATLGPAKWATHRVLWQGRQKFAWVTKLCLKQLAKYVAANTFTKGGKIFTCPHIFPDTNVCEIIFIHFTLICLLVHTIWF